MGDDLSKNLSRRDRAGLVLAVIGALLLGIAVSALLILWAIQGLNAGRLLAISGAFAAAVCSAAVGIAISLKAERERTERGLDEPVDHEARRTRAVQGARSMKTVMLLTPVVIALWLLLAYVGEVWDWRLAAVLGLAHLIGFAQAYFSFRRHTNELRKYERT